ncbi:neuraminidase-like domain-containing protein [Actimicrobium antarcticum]|uniref:Virulence plasmid A protein n=1 Tax=Actimicrobium antarcticum TaxID=1051899 RepID=A0ABP7TIL5_9BURK
MEHSKTVNGTLRSQAGEALDGLHVQLLEVSLRNEMLLGEATSNCGGSYSISYTVDDDNCDTRAAVSITVLSPSRQAVLYKTPGDALHFDTGQVETIDIVLSAPLVPEKTEFDDLVERIATRNARVPVDELQETDDHHDLSWLAHSLRIPFVRLEYFVLAHRLARMSEVDAPFFYALLRQNTLLAGNVRNPWKTRLGIDSNTDPEGLLYDIVLTEPQLIERDVGAAVKTRLVDDSTLGKMDSYLTLLERFRLQADAYQKEHREQQLIDLVTHFIVADKIGEAAALFKANRGDLSGVLKQITSVTFLGDKSNVDTLRTTLAIADVVGNDRALIATIAREKNLTAPEDVSKLARLNKRDWESLLTNMQLDTQVAAVKASSLARSFERAYPTHAFAAQLARDTAPTVVHGKDIAALLMATAATLATDTADTANQLDLQRDNLDLYFKRTAHAESTNTALRDELKKVQRVFRLAPRYATTSKLLARGVTSARDITAIGKTRFVSELAPAAGIGAKDAEAMYRKAEATSTAAMVVAGELQDIASAGPIAAVNSGDLTLALDQAQLDFPNLKSLFKGVDTCACEHCRSVYGPAAYLVELLEFIDHRSVTDLTVSPPVTTTAAQDVLLARRPDLGDIDLSCENANTPMPYIDLVNELLEEQVAPDPGIGYNGALAAGADPLSGSIAPALLSALVAAGVPMTDAALVFSTEVATGSSATLPHYIRDKQAVVKAVNTGLNEYTLFHLRQTLRPADELAAAPAYVNQTAYATLATESFAFGLPFDLPHTEARAYFARFDIDRAELMRNFQVAGTPSDAAIAAETLGLTVSQRALITTPDSAGQATYWRLPLADLKRVDVFLDKTGLSYTELDTLLTFAFIDPAKALFIKHLDLSCDLAQKQIAGLDNAALDRMHRFLRMQKATGWPLAVLDEILSQPLLGAGVLDDAALAVAATLQRLVTATGIKLGELVGCYENIPADLYASIFLNKARNGVIDPALELAKVDGTGFLANVAASVAVSLQVKRKDFDALLTLMVDNKLSIANLSRLFLYSRLMRRLKLTTTELSALIDLTRIDPTASPADTLAFAELAIDAKAQPRKLADVRFMLYHQAETTIELERRELKSATATTTLTTLQAAYQGAFAENRSPFNPDMPAIEQQEALARLLGKFSVVSADDSKSIAAFLQREWTSVAAAHSLIDTLFGTLFDPTAIHTAIDNLDALAPLADISAAAAALLRAIMDSLSLFQFNQAKSVLLTAQLSAAFKVDTELVQAVLAHAVLKQPAPGTAVVRDILFSNDLIDTLNLVPAPPAVTGLAFPQHYQALRLLHKLLPLSASYRLEPGVVAWLLVNAQDLGWLELDGIPYQSGHTEASYQAYADLGRALELGNTLAPVENPADAANPVTLWSVLAMTLPGSAATRDQFLEKLAILTAHEQDSLDAIDAYFFPAFSFANYRVVGNWQRLLHSAETLRTLASPLADVADFIKPGLTSIETGKLRMALKSRYDETTWLDTLKEVMDAIRPAKRDALVAYLLATRPAFRSANDLYDQWLIDVEMEACMPSSRIVLAHNAIQLFVQRCMMGLEPSASANTETDSGWLQWKWVSRFRVREANLKVWCYPENWLEAELRDDKSFLFQDLENELMQNELTTFTAERALTRYMEQLDALAFLEVVATWYQVDDRIMHVFARSKGGDPATYYHRQFQQERYWTPWVKIDLEITGDQLLAFSRNRRLHLCWPIFSDEPDPSPQATVPNSTPGTVVNTDKPKRKLKIQLAVSELADGVWQPKRISKDAIRTPNSYTTDPFEQHLYNLIYIEWADMVLLLKANGQDSAELRGIFAIAGCKGYPELLSEGNTYFPDFFPDFKDTLLTVQRYRETNYIAGDELSARTALSFFAYYDILTKTPGTFRITYPHQMTPIDWLALLLEYLLLASYGANTGALYDRQRNIKIPMGTLLPYFMEDSNHAYVITPGFYGRKSRLNLNTLTRRTASDVLGLIDKIVALYQKYMAKLKAGETPAQLLAELLADEDYHDIKAELEVYSKLQYGEKFSNMYHPLMCTLRRTLYQHGVPALMSRATQLQQSPFDFATHYAPTAIVPPPYPVEDVDFNSDGSYSGYNWELFFHVPMLIATQLTRNQRFDEAMDWLHYIFNPTGALPGDVPQKYWVTKPFFLRNAADYTAQRIDTLLYRAADLNDAALNELEFAIQQWRDHPFKPHVVARFRTVAYQKAILMKYIDNLVSWGDYLFRQDTMESIAQATQMYILSDKLLGPKPRVVPPVVTPPSETYYQIRAKLGPLGNALIDLENILPDLSALPEGGAELPPSPITLSTLYFCVPQNDRMLGYWDTIADRLFKIRHCQNIDGIERSLALFAPPIDPGMLVRAAASGLDISAVIAGLSAPLPYYRFQTVAQKAVDLAQEVRNLGNSLLQVLEKKDGEDLALLRSELEIKLQNAMTGMKKLAIEEAKEQIIVLQRSRKVTEEKYQYYAGIEKVSAKESLHLDKLDTAHDFELAAQISRALAGIVAMVPDLLGGASGFGGSPHVTLQWGGKNLAAAANSAADVLQILSASAAYDANRAAINGQNERRFDDWKLQERQAKKELASIDKQITVAEIRQQSAELDMKNHALTIENNKKTDEFMRRKFTNRDLYQWMIGQISNVYFAAYKLAHDQAKKAERTYQYELGRDDTFIAFGYWDTLKKGLQSADRLVYDLKRMEMSYLDHHKRDYEITKQVSLAALDPLALIKLQTTGSCDFSVPEALFDLDYPGQYFRRIKTVSLSMPCVAGPQTSISAKLSLTSNRYRKDLRPDNLALTGYSEDPGNDERFVYNLGTIQSIATSTGQKDSGLFDLNFRDERYLPFEGTGAISNWRCELVKPALAQFNYDTIADVVLHLGYTAREGGSSLRSLAETDLLDRLGQIKQELSQQGLHTLINLRHELPNEWHLLKQAGSVNITLDKLRLPYLAQVLDATIDNVVLLARVAGNPATFSISLDGAASNLSRLDAWRMCKAETTGITLGDPVAVSVLPANLGKLQDLLLVVKYGFS